MTQLGNLDVGQIKKGNSYKIELANEAMVLRLDEHSDVGLEAVKRYGIRGLPTLIVVNGCGKAVASYGGVPDADRIAEVVRGIPACNP
ncbi:MAG: hypothetical protein JXB30_05640 [Anaerolineae bacterium]|nr:hypothetical protein [Anaerolineae bacterium]